MKFLQEFSLEVQLDILKGKSLWLGRNGEELTVEELALQRYEAQGFKGFASTLLTFPRYLIIFIQCSH